jgi:hypothetical protein
MHPGEEVYRARVANTPADVKRMKESPVAEFASPPKDRASNQRMTPIGIPALYCALERETCLSEIRSITGDHVVSIALTPTREIRLLDLTKLEDMEGPNLSLLDEGRRKAVNLSTFIRSLVQKMSRPKARNDELSYLSTQVVFEYLSLSFASQVQGLVFPSVQTGEQGLNVVLFPESSKISAHPYLRRDEADPDFGANIPQPFEAHATLAYIANSFKFHKVKAIVTVAETFESSALLYMSELDKQRLGIH